MRVRRVARAVRGPLRGHRDPRRRRLRLPAVGGDAGHVDRWRRDLGMGRPGGGPARVDVRPPSRRARRHPGGRRGVPDGGRPGRRAGAGLVRRRRGALPDPPGGAHRSRGRVLVPRDGGRRRGRALRAGVARERAHRSRRPAADQRRPGPRRGAPHARRDRAAGAGRGAVRRDGAAGGRRQPRRGGAVAGRRSRRGRHRSWRALPVLALDPVGGRRAAARRADDHPRVPAAWATLRTSPARRWPRPVLARRT